MAGLLIFFANITISSNALLKLLSKWNSLKLLSYRRLFKSLPFNKPNSSNQDYKIIERREIQIFKLDTILCNKNLKKPIILKLDVQGYEMEVLKGSLKILKRINYILIEVSKSEIYKNQATEKQIINFLKKRNFFPLNSTKSTKINKTNFLQRDILFKRKDKF